MLPKKKTEKKTSKKKAADHTDDHAIGHRNRLRDRFRRAGADALEDYEVLELILFRAVPRGDVKPLAKSMLKRFGSFSAVIAAPRTQLISMSGIGARIADELNLLHAASVRLAKHKILKRPLMSSWPDVIDYCQCTIGYDHIEQFRVLFLDNKNCLIADEAQQKGTVNYTTVYPREIVNRALEIGASSVILVHNHPSGDTTPSANDIKITKEIVKVLAPLKIIVHDHIIVGRGAMANFKNLNLL